MPEQRLDPHLNTKRGRKRDVVELLIDFNVLNDVKNTLDQQVTNATNANEIVQKILNAIDAQASTLGEVDSSYSTGLSELRNKLTNLPQAFGQVSQACTDVSSLVSQFIDEMRGIVAKDSRVDQNLPIYASKNQLYWIIMDLKNHRFSDDNAILFAAPYAGNSPVALQQITEMHNSEMTDYRKKANKILDQLLTDLENIRFNIVTTAENTDDDYITKMRELIEKGYYDNSLSLWEYCVEGGRAIEGLVVGFCEDIISLVDGTLKFGDALVEAIKGNPEPINNMLSDFHLDITPSSIIGGFDNSYHAEAQLHGSSYAFGKVYGDTVLEVAGFVAGTTKIASKILGKIPKPMHKPSVDVDINKAHKPKKPKVDVAKPNTKAKPKKDVTAKTDKTPNIDKHVKVDVIDNDVHAKKEQVIKVEQSHSDINTNKSDKYDDTNKAVDVDQSLTVDITDKKQTFNDDTIEVGAKPNKVEIKEVPYGEHRKKNDKNEIVELNPNVRYKDKNGYQYETDSLGRIIKAKTTIGLKLKKAARKLKAQTSAGGKWRLEGDHGGHLFASIFNGSGELDNIVAMNGNLNQSAYRKLENKWKSALEQGQRVDVDIELVYEGESLRPSGFNINYAIDNEWQKPVKFKNEYGGGIQ